MLKTHSSVFKSLSVALALALGGAILVPPAFAGDSDNSPEMTGRPAWMDYRRDYRKRPPRADYRRHRDYRRYRDYRRHRHYRRRNDDAAAAILGGILGLGAGLAIGNATAPRQYYDGGRYPAWSPQWYRYCERRYRSFNPRTGYFLGYDGRYHFCRAR